MPDAAISQTLQAYDYSKSLRGDIGALLDSFLLALSKLSSECFRTMLIQSLMIAEALCFETIADILGLSISADKESPGVRSIT